MKKTLDREEAMERICTAFAPLRVGFNSGFAGDPIGFCIYYEDPDKPRSTPYSIGATIYSDEERLVKGLAYLKEKLSR
jgi:hypothetical protein